MTKMSKDPAIKLFGRTIPLHVSQPDPTALHLSTESSSSESDKVSPKETKSIEANQNLLTDPKPDTEPESNKTLKKPDKILPCPRCNSMETKFCYYNNYNVNQPRHFCKNCQRYWTAGGTMRNVPVGAGRRKNKPPHNYRHVIMTSSSSSSEPVLKFGSEAPLCESMANNLNIQEDKKINNDEQSSSSCSTTSTEGNVDNNFNLGTRMQFYPPGPGFVWAPFIPAGSVLPGPWWTGFANIQPCALGKHCREPGLQTDEKDSKLCPPKSLRTVGPNLGIKHDEKSLFKVFEKKGGGLMDAGPVLNANPAALSRFESFRERT